MAFKDHFKLKHTSIDVSRGRFREEVWFEPCFEGKPEECKKVYTLLEMVYNMGEHDGRKYVRSAVKEALDIEL